MPSTEKDIEAIVAQVQAQNDIKNGPVFDNDWIPLGLWNGSPAWDMKHQIGGDGSAAKKASKETLAKAAQWLDNTPWNDHGGNSWKTKTVIGPDGHSYAMTSDHPDAVLDQNTNRAYLVRNGTLVPAVQRKGADGKVEIVEAKEAGHVHAGQHTELADGAKADVETIQRDLTQRGLYHYKVEGDWGSRTNRGLEKLIVQAQIDGQKNGSYRGKVNGEYNDQTRTAMQKMGVSQETLAALDRLQSTNQRQAFYKPSGDPMLCKTAGLMTVFHDKTSAAEGSTASVKSPDAAAHGPVSPKTFVDALDRALTRLDKGPVSLRDATSIFETTTSPAEKALWGRVLQNMNPNEPLTKDKLVDILSKDVKANYSYIAGRERGTAKGQSALAALNAEMQPTAESAYSVLAKHGLAGADAARLSVELAKEGIALQVASIGAIVATPSGRPARPGA